MKKLAKVIMAGVFAATVAVMGVVEVTQPAVAEQNVCDNMSLSAEDKALLGCNNNSEQQKKAANAATTLVNGVIGFVGVIAVAVMIYGGIYYAIATGDPGKTKRARDIVMYGLIGLAISILAFAIVNFLLANFINKV